MYCIHNVVETDSQLLIEVIDELGKGCMYVVYLYVRKGLEQKLKRLVSGATGSLVRKVCSARERSHKRRF